MIVLFLLILTSCKTRTNYDLIKEYFTQTKNTVSAFSTQCDWDTKSDTILVKECIRIQDYGFTYTVELMGRKLEIIFTPNSIIATKDSCSVFSILEQSNYERKIKDVFIEPEFKNVSGKYREFNNKDINGKDSLSFEMINDYAYKIYFTLDKEDLILHKDYSFKTERNWSYYFSKEKGLYKIIFVEGGQCTLLKIKNNAL